MKNNTSLSSVFSSALTAQQILDLANTADLTGMDDFQLAEFNRAVEALKEQVRIDAEYQQDVPVVEEKAEPAEKPVLKDASKVVGCGLLVDNAYVHDMSEDDDDVIVESSSDDDDDVVVARGYRGTPEDGEHIVTLVDYPDKQHGKNGKGDFRIFRFRDVKTYLEWTAFVAEDDLMDRLSQISYNNNGMFSGMNKKKAFESMMVNPIDVWTCKRTVGDGVITYYDENKFNRYFRWVSSQKAEAELKYATKHSKNVSNEERAKDYQF